MSRVLEKGESSKHGRKKLPIIRNISGKELVEETSNANVVRTYERSKKPRLRWSEDLHHSFLRAVAKLGGEDRATPKMILHVMGVDGITVSHVKSHLQMHRSMRQATLIQEAIDAAKKNGNDDAEFIAKLPELVNSPSRSVSRRQTRLQRLKALLVKNALDKHFLREHQLPQPQPQLAKFGDSSKVTTIHMPGENGRKSHAYMMFNDLLKSSTSITDQFQENKDDGKEKLIYDQHATSGFQLNDSKKLGVGRIRSFVTAPVISNQDKMALELTL